LIYIKCNAAVSIFIDFEAEKAWIRRLLTFGCAFPPYPSHPRELSASFPREEVTMAKGKGDG